MPWTPLVRHLAPVAVASLLALALAGCEREGPQELLEEARSDLQKNEPQVAIVRLRLALQGDPGLTEARYLLGRALLRNGEAAGAVFELQKALEAGHDRNQVLPTLAAALLVSGQSRQLVQQYGQLELGDPLAQAAVRTSVSSAWLQLRDAARADAALTAALEAAPEYGPALVLRGHQKAASGDLASAKAIVDAVIAREPKLVDAWHLRCELRAAGQRDFKGAEEACRKALEIDRNHVPSYLTLIALRMQAGDPAGAKALIAEMRKALPGHPQALYAEAQLAYAANDQKALRESVQSLLKMAPEHPGVLQLAGAMEARAGALVVAESHFAKALQFEPSSSFARLGLAQVYLRLGQFARAKSTILPLLEVAPNSPEALAVAGEAELRSGDPALAQKYFERAAQTSPEDARLRSGVAVAQLARGQDALGFEQLRTLAKESRDTVPDLLLIGAQMQRRDYDAALKAVDAFAAKQPGSAAVHDLRGQVLMTKGDYAAAAKAFEQALAADPRYVAAIVRLATLEALQNRTEQARARLEQAAKLFPDDARSQLVLAETDARLGASVEQVRAMVAEIVKLAPNDPAPRLLLVETALKAGQPQVALASAQEALAALPNQVDLLDALGRAQLQAGSTQLAITTFRSVTSLAPKSVPAQLRLAEALRAAGDSAGAVISLRRALELDPDSEPARVGLAGLLTTSGRTREAVAIAQELQRSRPDSATGYLLEGAVHARAKAPDAAIDVYRNGLRQLKDSSELAVALYDALAATGRAAEGESMAASWLKSHPRDAAMLYAVSSAQIERGGFATAERHLATAVEVQARNPVLLNNLAYVLLAQGKPGAVPLAQRAAELMPDHPDVLDTLALALAADRRLPEALELQKKAVGMAPGNANLRFNLARLAVQTGDKPLARTELERLAALGSRYPKHAEVASMLKAL